MKAFRTLLYALAISFVAVDAFAQDDSVPQTKNIQLANVYRTDGVYIFVDSDPVSDYEVTNRSKVAFSWAATFSVTGTYSKIKSKLLRRVLKRAPDSDGVLLTFDTGGVDLAAAIKFKDRSSEKKGQSLVRKEEGICIFTECEPVSPYTVLGREKIHVSWTGQYTELRSIMLKKTKRDYPDAEGVIFSSNIDEAVIIKFDKP